MVIYKGELPPDWFLLIKDMSLKRPSISSIKCKLHNFNNCLAKKRQYRRNSCKASHILLILEKVYLRLENRCQYLVLGGGGVKWS